MFIKPNQEYITSTPCKGFATLPIKSKSNKRAIHNGHWFKNFTDTLFSPLSDYEIPNKKDHAIVCGLTQTDY